MLTCKQCGIEVEENVAFCPACGAAIESVAESVIQEALAEETAEEPAVDTVPVEETVEEPITAPIVSADATEHKAMAVLAYLGILVLIPIFAAKDSKFARFHANQGLVLLIASLAVNIVGNLAQMILAPFAFLLAGLVGTLVSLVGLVFFVLTVLGIVNAVQGAEKELPIIGKFRILK
ncbi:MAG: zinc ribbon domain-containing protein [Ruminococcaceae bacterium]|nr:zinc ribbon domain-containing protein [Oscillospiraceae bacterium]